MKLTKTLLIPYLKRFWLMLLSVILVGAFGCGILIGLRNAYHSLNTNVNSLISECGYPDLYVQTIGKVERKYVNMLPSDFKSSMGIKNIEYRAAHTTTFSLNDYSYSTKLIGYDNNSLLKHHLMEGNVDKINVRIDYYFAIANKIKVGDIIKAKMPDGAIQEYKIEATIVSPETSNVKADPYSFSSSRDFAYVYVPKNTIDAHSSELYFNEILVDYKDGQEKSIDETITALREYIETKTEIEITDEMITKLRKNIAYATTYEDSEVIEFYDSALKAINSITLLAPAVFFLVVLIVTALFLFQIVKQCRKDIGVMRALGESSNSISLVYLSIGFVTGFLAWAVGVGVGSIFTLLANNAYGSALKLFHQPFVMHPSALFSSLGIIIFVTVLTSFLASLNISRIKPVEAMKALPPTKNNTPLLTRTLFKKAPITLKVTISQTLRNIIRYILSGLCLLSSGMLIFIALSIGESKNTMMHQLFDVRLNYDVQVYLNDEPSEEEIELEFPSSDENIIAKTYIKYLPSEIINKSNNKEITALVNGIKNDQDLINVVSDYDNIITIPEGGIVLSTYHAYLLDAKVGDIVTANDTDLVVSAISNEFIFQVSYTRFEDYSPDYSRGSLLLNVKDQDEFFNTYKDKDNVTYIAFTNIIKNEFNDRLAAFEISSKLLTFMAIVIGFMIVFNMMQTNLKEQKRTFATMRTLGYQRSSISNSNLLISVFQYIFAMVFAIPIGILLSKGLLRVISVPSQIQPFPKTWVTYVFTLVFVLVFLLISHFLVMSKMKKWNLPESVKERE